MSAAQVGEGVQELVNRGAQTITYFSVGAPGLYPVRTDPLPEYRVIGATVYLNEFLANSQQQFAAIAAQGVRVNFFNFSELQRRLFPGLTNPANPGEAARFGFFNETNVPPTTAQVPCPAVPCVAADAAGYFLLGRRPPYRSRI